LKIENYYQQLYSVPVEQRPTSYSILNDGADFGVAPIDSLENKGTGKNRGAEITIEKFYSKGYYFLITGSFFDSNILPATEWSVILPSRKIHCECAGRERMDDQKEKRARN